MTTAIGVVVRSGTGLVSGQISRNLHARLATGQAEIATMQRTARRARLKSICYVQSLASQRIRKGTPPWQMPP